MVLPFPEGLIPCSSGGHSPPLVGEALRGSGQRGGGQRGVGEPVPRVSVRCLTSSIYSIMPDLIFTHSSAVPPRLSVKACRPVRPPGRLMPRGDSVLKKLHTFALDLSTHPVAWIL